MSRVRNFCFTDFELRDWKAFFDDGRNNVRYVCFGKEICPTTQKDHYQGWLQFEKPLSKGACYARLNGKKGLHTTSVRPCYGTEEHNETYCKKEGKWYTYGEFKKQGQRTDLEDIYEKVVNDGLTLKDIALGDPYMYCQYRNGIKDLVAWGIEERTKSFRDVEVIVHWGRTRTGKTRAAHEQAGDDYFTIKGGGMKWWDGYNGQKTLIIDEYKNNVPIDELLGLLDGYQHRLALKGSHTFANWTKVYITANQPPSAWHDQALNEHHEAMMARITRIIKFGN